MSNNTELIDKESLDKIIADIKAILKRTSLDALNSVQWEFNQRYLFGNEVDKPIIKAGKLFTKEGPVAKGAIWTSLDTGKLWMNTGSGWKNIGGLNNINKPDLIEIFHPRTDYPVETPYTTTNAGGEFWVPFKFKKYEKYSITKGQCPFTGFLTRTSNSRTDIAQDVRTSFSSGPGTYEFICMVDDAKYFYFTTGSSSNTTDLTLTDLGSAIEPVKISNMTETNRFVTFPIEKGKRYYYTKTARSFYIGYGKGSKSVQNPDNRLKQVNNSGDSGAGTWSFVAEHDADWLYLFIGPDAVLESFEFRCEDLPDYKLTYPHVVKSGESFPAEPKVGDMVFDGSALKKIPKWWNGTSWITANGDSNPLQGKRSGYTSFGDNASILYEVGTFGIAGGSLEATLGSDIEYVKSISTFPIMEDLMSSANAPDYLASLKVVKDYVDAKTSVSMLATTDAPVTANEGTVYYDTTEQNLKIYYGGEWRTIINFVKCLPNDTEFTGEGLLRHNGRSLSVFTSNSWQLIQGSAAYITGTSVNPGFIRAGCRVNTATNKLLIGGRDNWSYWRLREKEEQVVTFTNSSGETIVAIECEQIIVTASFGSVSILDFTDIEKEEGKTIEINILASSIIRVKDGATEKDLTDCNGSIVKAICLSNVWHFYKVSGITEIVNHS